MSYTIKQSTNERGQVEGVVGSWRFCWDPAIKLATIATDYAGSTILLVLGKVVARLDVHCGDELETEDEERLPNQMRSTLSKVLVGMAAGYGAPNLDALVVAINCVDKLRRGMDS